MKKKKLIRITPPAKVHHYHYNNISFAFVSNPNFISGRTQCTKTMTCRETINKMVYLHKNKEVDYSENAPIDFEKLRILIIKDMNEDLYNEFKTNLFSGKALLNRYEEKKGWALSKIATVKHPNYENAWLLTGPKAWMSQPQRLSICTLLIRLMSVHGQKIKVDGTLQQAEDNLKTLYNTYMNKKKETVDEIFKYFSDIEYYLKYVDDINLLLTNTEKIFDGIGLEDAWSNTNFNSSFSIYSGILSFFTKEHLDYNKKVMIARNRFMEIKTQQNKDVGMENKSYEKS
jgi:hypothetical protein